MLDPNLVKQAEAQFNEIGEQLLLKQAASPPPGMSLPQQLPLPGVAGGGALGNIIRGSMSGPSRSTALAPALGAATGSALRNILGPMFGGGSLFPNAAPGRGTAPAPSTPAEGRPHNQHDPEMDRQHQQDSMRTGNQPRRPIFMTPIGPYDLNPNFGLRTPPPQQQGQRTPPPQARAGMSGGAAGKERRDDELLHRITRSYTPYGSQFNRQMTPSTPIPTDPSTFEEMLRGLQDLPTDPNRFNDLMRQHQNLPYTPPQPATGPNGGMPR